GKPGVSDDDAYGAGPGDVGSAWVGPKIASIHCPVLQRGCRIVSNSSAPVGGEFRPPSDGSRQSPWPPKPAAFTWLSQSQTVVMPPFPLGSTSHVPVVHVPQPTASPSAPAVQVAAAAAFG